MKWPAESVPYADLNLNATLAKIPMLMAHNAATVYMTEGNFANPTPLYAKNQDKNSEDPNTFGLGKFSDLLNCGARALDLELFDDPSSAVGFKHGVLGEINGITLQDGLADIKSWSDEYSQELVLLSVDCPETNEKCSDRVLQIFKSSNVEFVTNCTTIKKMTTSEAMKKGPVLAVSKTCIVQNYEDLSCHGAMPSTQKEKIDEIIEMFADYQAGPTGYAKFFQEYDQVKLKLDNFPTYSCWEEDPNKNIPIEALFNFLEKVEAENSSSEDMWQWQGLWHSNNLTVILGLNLPRPLPTSILSLTPSSIKNDITKSNLNKLVFEYIQKHNPSDFNLVSMDFVCNEYGKKMIGALRPTSDSKPPTASPTSSDAKYFIFQHVSIFAIVSSLVLSYV